MNKGVVIWLSMFCIALLSLLFVCDTMVDNKKLEEAYATGYEEGYAALDLEQIESGKTYIDGYIKGLEEGKEKGMAAVKAALEDPHSLSSEFLLNSLGIDIP